MKINLKINGEKKDFTIGYINMMTVRKALEIQEKINLSNPTIQQLDIIIDFIVEAFDNQFTRDDIYRGIPAKGFMTKIVDVVNQIVEVLNKTADEMGE